MVPNVGLCRYAIFQPSDAEGDPVAALAGALFQETALPELNELLYTPEAVAHLLIAAPKQVLVRQGLARAEETAGLVGGAEARLCLVIDQFEELFTLQTLAGARRNAFVDALVALAGSGLVWVVATMRSDFFDHLESLSTLAALTAGDGRYLLTPPTDGELGQLIRRPAQVAGPAFRNERARRVGA